MRYLVIALLLFCGTAHADVSSPTEWTDGVDSVYEPWKATFDSITDNGDGTITVNGGAPTDATYITQTANGDLSAEQALGSLSTGVVTVTTTTGVLDSVVPGTSGNVLTSNGTAWTSAAPAGGGVGGSTGATDNAVLRADGTGGSTVQNSLLTVADTTGLLTTGASGQDSGLYFTDDYTSTANGRIAWGESANTFTISGKGLNDADSLVTPVVIVKATSSGRAARMDFKGGTGDTVGLEIGAGEASINFIAGVGSGAAGLFFHQSSNYLGPFTGPTSFGSGGALSDGVVSLGVNGFRFKDIWMSNDLVVGSNLGGKVNIDGSADEVQLWVQGHSTQTNELLLVEASDGTDNFKINNAGEVYVRDMNTGGNAGTDVCIDANNRLCACGTCA